MIENISLIKEVHEHTSIKEAQRLASEYLKKINLQKIALLRQNECTKQEKFYVMFIRALMSKEKKIIIIPPFSITNSDKKIDVLIKNIELFNDNKEVYVFDILTNEMHYKGCICHIIK